LSDKNTTNMIERKRNINKFGFRNKYILKQNLIIAKSTTRCHIKSCLSEGSY